MASFLIANIAPIMFIGLIVVLLMGYPVAFALAFNGIFFGLVGIKLGLLDASLFQALPERLFGVMANDTLLAVPFFTFMGLILERSGMAEDLLDTIGQLFGPVRGGLAFAVIFVGALLAATTGVVAASVISMGLISLPIMLRYGYDRRFASGVIAASGTLAQIIPPSLVLIIMADQLGRSVGDMYAGAFIPGIALAGLYTAYALGVAIAKPAWAPALPEEARKLKEPNGSSGNTSVAVLVVLSVVAAVLFDRFYYVPTYPDAALDERLVLAAGGGAGFALAVALLNRITKLGLLSRMAERPGRERLINVADESWKIVQHTGLGEWFQSNFKLARQFGVMNLVVLHKLADLSAAGDAGSRSARIAEGLVADASTRIVYHQDESQVPLTRTLLGLSESEARLIAMLSPGQALWRVGSRSFVVQHYRSTLEARLTNTDTGMRLTSEAVMRR